MTSTKQLIYVCQRIALLQRDKVTILFTTVMDLSLGKSIMVLRVMHLVQLPNLAQISLEFSSVMLPYKQDTTFTFWPRNAIYLGS